MEQQRPRNRRRAGRLRPVVVVLVGSVERLGLVDSGKSAFFVVAHLGHTGVGKSARNRAREALEANGVGRVGR